MDMNEDTVMDLEFGWFHTFFSFNVALWAGLEC